MKANVMKIKTKGSANAILHGVILPSLWNEEGEVMRISLNTQDEDEYIIYYSGRGKELLNHLRENIEIEGKVLQRIGGALYVKVNSYHIINDM